MVAIVGDARNLDLSKFEKYGVIIADPPWDFQNQQNASTFKHYTTMTDQEIQAMPLQELSLPDCVLFLWGTWAKVDVAIDTIRAWGFMQKTGFPWVKLDHDRLSLSYGVGYWLRGCSEYVLIGCKGKVSPPGELSNYLGIMSPNFQHSRKPISVHELAETLPGPYLELFGRRLREGWDVFGNEIEGEIPSSPDKFGVVRIF